MDKAKKNTVIHAAADRMAANYKSSQIPMYGDALRMPNRNAVIEIIRDCQKLILRRPRPLKAAAGAIQRAFDGAHPRKADAPDYADDAGVRRELRSGLCDQHGIHRAHPCHSGVAAQGPVGEL